MEDKRYALKAEITTADSQGIEELLGCIVGEEAIEKTDKGFHLKAMLTGESARELNRKILSTLRSVSKTITLRAEWTHDGVTERFFDYEPKGIREA